MKDSRTLAFVAHTENAVHNFTKLSFYIAILQMVSYTMQVFASTLKDS